MKSKRSSKKKSQPPSRKRVPCERCKVPKLFYLAMDHELSPAKAKELKTYLAANRRCLRHLRFEKSLRKVLEQQMGKTASSKLKKEILKALR